MKQFLLSNIITINLIVLIALVLIFKKKFYKNRNEKWYKIVLIVFVIIFLVVILFPYSKFFRFETPLDSLKFHNSNVELVKEYLYDDYAFVLFNYDGNGSFTHCIKESSSWNCNLGHTINQREIKSFNGYFIFVSTLDDKNTTSVVVNYNNLTANKSVVTDSLNSDFDEFTMEKPKIKEFYHVAKIDKELNKDYKIFINGKEYSIFD